MSDKYKQTGEMLRQRQGLLTDKRAFIGFDGYVDELLDIVQSKIDAVNYKKFDSMKTFGKFLVENIGSCGLEVISKGRKIGGNGPIMAKSISKIGLETNCIGAFGMPTIEMIFGEMPDKCQLLSIGQPAYTQAFEFADGKMMFGRQQSLDSITWQTVRDAIGIERLATMINSSDLMAITNWSQLVNANDLWDGLVKECLPLTQAKLERYIFFDLSDPSKRSHDDIRQMIELLSQYRRYGRVVLGLNLQEANHLHFVMTGEMLNSTDSVLLAEKLQTKLAVDILVVHSAKQVTAVQGAESVTETCIKIKQPQSFTGCGDNFNAGFMLGLLLELPLLMCIITGNCLAAYYIENGESPSWDELLRFVAERGGC